MKRSLRAKPLVIVLMMVATFVSLVSLAPIQAPAIDLMQVTVTTVKTVTPNIVNTVVFTFTFSNVTTSITFTSYIATETLYYASFTTYTATTTVPTSVTTTVTTYRSTRTLGTTTVPSTSTIWTTVTGTTTSPTITTSTTETQTFTAAVTTSETVTVTYTVTQAEMPVPPPISGFPLESILAGLGLGLLGLDLIYRNRKARRQQLK